MTDAIDKIDLKTFIGDLEKEEKPRTLEEIYREVGFPFSAKAVVEFSDSVWPLGAVVTCFDVVIYKEDWSMFATIEDHGSPNHYPRAAISNAPRWQLLGHKT